MTRKPIRRQPTHRPSSHRSPTSPKPQGGGGGFWRGLSFIALGFTLGVGSAAYFAAYINNLPMPLITPPTRDAEQAPADSLLRARRETLEFYETLQRKWLPEDSETKTDSPSSAPPAAETPPPEPETPAAEEAVRTVYYLQLGAFTDRDAAETVRGEAALFGAQSSIRALKNDDKEVFRVWTGPYAALAAAEEARANLALQGYNKVQIIKSTEKERQ